MIIFSVSRRDGAYADPRNDQEPVDYVRIDFEIGRDDSEVPSQFQLVRQDASAPIPSRFQQFQLVRQNASALMLSRDSYISISDTEDDESSRYELDPSRDSRQHK
jgi:hypothetical protein